MRYYIAISLTDLMESQYEFQANVECQLVLGEPGGCHHLLLSVPRNCVGGNNRKMNYKGGPQSLGPYFLYFSDILMMKIAFKVLLLFIRHIEYGLPLRHKPTLVHVLYKELSLFVDINYTCQFP